METFGDKWRGCDIFSNLESFQSLLTQAFHGKDPHDPELHSRITNLMAHVQINPEEWKAQAQLQEKHFTRVLIGQTEDWMLILTCWDKDQGTPIHDHQGSYNWIKVLHGDLLEENFQLNNGLGELELERRRKLENAQGNTDLKEEVDYQENSVKLVRSGLITKDSVTFLNRDIIHRIRNVSGRPTFSLHLYSPPYTKAKAYDYISGDTTLVFLPRDRDPSDPNHSWHI